MRTSRRQPTPFSFFFYRYPNYTWILLTLAIMAMATALFSLSWQQWTLALDNLIQLLEWNTRELSAIINVTTRELSAIINASIRSALAQSIEFQTALLWKKRSELDLFKTLITLVQHHIPKPHNSFQKHSVATTSTSISRTVHRCSPKDRAAVHSLNQNQTRVVCR
jgi:hypothetical protein